MRKEFSGFYFAGLTVLIIIATGTAGYIFLEKFTFSEALYMTIITLSTVGFQEVKPISESGRIFTVFLIISGLGTFGYYLTRISKMLLDGNYRKLLKDLKTKKKLKKMKNHIIICGFGRNGRQAARELLNINREIVIIDKKPEIINLNIYEDLARNKNLTFLEGDAAHETSLLQAGITQAEGIITTLPYDADNLLIVLTAADLNKKIKIISRASDEHSFSKLKRAGADNVIMPDIVGGARMAKLIIEPNIMEFLEVITLQKDVDVKIEEIACTDVNLHFAETSIKDLDIRRKTGANIIGLKLADGNYVFNPGGKIQLKPNDRLFVLGSNKQILKLRELLQNGEIFT